MKKVIIFGNQQICIDCLEILLSRKDVSIQAVVGCETLQDKLYGYPSVKAYCKKRGMKYLLPEKLDEEFLETIRKLKPDLGFSLFFRKIFKKDLIESFPLGIINLHTSLLPKYRGPVPTLWALLNGEKETGVTLHYIDVGVDTGDIIAQKKFKTPLKITGFELNNLAMKHGKILFENQIELILNGKNKRVKQDHSKATYYGPFRQSLRVVDWKKSNEDIYNQVRVLTRPYLGAIASILDKDIIFWSSRILDRTRADIRGPGKIVEVKKDGSFVLSTVNGYILIEGFEIPGIEKRKLKAYIKENNKFNL